ncbi:MAG TPA: tetraspanin family protein [Candidatus Limnocylindrales bacterium]|nr:tetraspanin family protein [Candidatus Limnocylindrales bacterium]
MTEPNQPSPTPPVDPEARVDPEPPADPAPPPGPSVEPSPPVDPPPPPDSPPATEWREPPWFPPRDKRERKANIVAIVVGLIILAVGIYYFIDRTLGVAMPRIQWGSLWPVLLIVLGGVVVLRSMQRR